jgi:hypothetical protein
MNKKKEWMKCSLVAVGFYLIVYLMLGQFTSLGFTNPWLISLILLFAAGDVWGLKWFITNYWDDEHDDHLKL